MANRQARQPYKPYTVVASYVDNNQVLVTYVHATDGQDAITAAERWARRANGWTKADYPERVLLVHAVFLGHLVSEADDYDEVTGEPKAETELVMPTTEGARAVSVSVK